MTLKDFIKQATEEYGWGASFFNHETFEQLIRADERRACAKLCADADKSTHPSDLAAAILARGQA
jgi:hypothetical protein